MASARVSLITTIACAAFLLVGSSSGQSTFGSITGIVTDPSGGAVPKAQVTVTNEGTQAVRETNTGATGVFNVANLDIGVYRPARRRAGVFNVRKDRPQPGGQSGSQY